MSSDFDARIKVGADTREAEAGIDRVNEKVGSMGDVASRAGAKASAALDGMGKSGEDAATKFTRSEAAMSSAMRRAVEQMEIAVRQGKSLSDAFQFKAEIRGLDASKFEPILERMRQLESQLSVTKAAEEAFAAQNAFAKKHQQATELAKASQYTSWWAAELEKVEAAERKLASESAFISSLKAQSDALGKTRADLLELQAAQMGVSSQAAPFIAKMREAETGMAGAGMSAKAMNAAMRGVPAQISDIVVSLQGGMPVMTVFMQQGFQLRDMFGGFGPAAKALGSTLLGLVNPYTVAAAGVAALGATMLHTESTLRTHMTLMNQLEATGRAGFLNADAVKQLKNDMAELPSISRSTASAIISDLVQVRTLGGEALQKIALMSADFAAATGQDAAGAAKELAKAMEEPDKAARALDEAFNFLTVQQLIAIDAMVEAGDKAGAQKLLLDALGQSLSGTAEKQTEMQKASKELSNAWDDLMQSMAPSVETMHTVSSGLAGVARGINSITEAIPRANAEITKWLPGMQAMMGPLGMWARIKGLKAIEAEASASASSAAAVTPAAIVGGADRGAVSPPLAGSAGAKSEADKELSELLDTTKAFKGKKDAAEELSKTLGRLQGQQQRLRDEGRGDSKEAEELQTRINGVNEKIKSLSKTRSDGSKKEQTAYAELAATIQGKIDANQAEVDQSGKLNEAQKAEIKLNADLKEGKVKLSAAHEADLRKRIEIWKQQEKDKEQTKQNVAMYQQQLDVEKQVTEDYLKRSKALESARQAMDAYEKSAQEDHERLQLEAGLIGMSNQARAVALAQYDAELELKRKIAEINKLDATSAQKDELIDRARAVSFQRVANAQIKASNDEWNKAYDQASQSLSNALMDGGRSGADYVAGLFRSLVLRPVIQAIVSPVAGSIASAITSVMGGGQPGGASAGLVQNGLSIASLGKNISGAITGGFEALGGQVATYVQSGMNMLSGSGGAVWQGPVQVGGVAQGVGTAAGVAAGVAGGVYGGRLISGGYSAFGGASGNSAVNTGTAIGATIGSIVPVIGTALGALVGGLLGGTVNRLFGRKLADQGIEGTFGGEDAFEGNAYRFMKGGLFRSDKTERSALDEELRKGLADQFSVMRLSASAMAEVLGLGTAAIDGFTSSIKVSFNGLSEDEIEKRLTEEFDKVAESLAGVALGTTDYTKAGETAVQSLARLSGSLTAVNGVFDQLSTALYASSLAGADMASSLLDLFGGADGFGTATGTYFQNFYSGEEQRDALERQLNAALAKVNLQLPDIDQDTAREQYRALADAQDLTTESGRKAWATLMQLSGSFAQLTKSADDVAAAAKEAGKSMEGLLSERRQLEAELLNAQGDAAGYAAAMRTIAIEGFGPAEIAAYDYNEALKSQIASFEKAASLRSSLIDLGGRLPGAGEEVKQLRAEDLASQVRGLFADIGIDKDAGVLAGQILSATSGEVEDFFRSMWGMLPTDEARQELVNVTGALLDLAGTAEAAAESVNQERMGLEQRLLQSLGATEELRRRELAALDPSNRALQQLIYGIEDLQSAATTAAQEAAAAWQNWGTAAGLSATHLGDTSGLEARRAILGSQIASSTDPADRLSKLQELISVEQAIGQAQQASRKTELEAINARQSALQKEVANAQQLLSAAQGLGSYVQSLRLSEASGLSDADRLGALGNEYTALVGKARGGDADALQRLQSVAGDYLGLSQTLSASGSDYSVLAGRVSAELEAVSKAQELVAQSQVTGYEAQIAQLAQQSELLSAQVELSDGTKSLIAKSMVDQADAWDRENTQALTLQELQQRAVDSLALMPAGIASAIKPTIEGSATYLANSLGGTVSNALSSLAGMLDLDGSHAAGLAFVPKDGYRAELHYGERVLTAEENRAYSAPRPFVMQAGSQVNAELLAEVRALRAQVAALQRPTEQIAAATTQQAEQFDNVTAGGNAMATEAF